MGPESPPGSPMARSLIGSSACRRRSSTPTPTPFTNHCDRGSWSSTAARPQRERTTSTSAAQAAAQSCWRARHPALAPCGLSVGRDAAGQHDPRGASTPRRAGGVPRHRRLAGPRARRDRAQPAPPVRDWRLRSRSRRRDHDQRDPRGRPRPLGSPPQAMDRSVAAQLSSITVTGAQAPSRLSLTSLRRRSRIEGEVVAWLRLANGGLRATCLGADRCSSRRLCSAAIRRCTGSLRRGCTGTGSAGRATSSPATSHSPTPAIRRSRGRIHGLALWLPPGTDPMTRRMARDAAFSIPRLHGRGVDVAVAPRDDEPRPLAAHPRPVAASRRTAGRRRYRRSTSAAAASTSRRSPAGANTRGSRQPVAFRESAYAPGRRGDRRCPGGSEPPEVGRRFPTPTSSCGSSERFRGRS